LQRLFLVPLSHLNISIVFNPRLNIFAQTTAKAHHSLQDKTPFSNREHQTLSDLHMATHSIAALSGAKKVKTLALFTWQQTRFHGLLWHFSRAYTHSRVLAFN
jgi:hypothetical protein